MKNTEFLELSHPTRSARKIRKILKKLNESYVILWRESVGIKIGNEQWYDFYILCPTTNFASAYFQFGLLYAEQVLPIWESRFKKSKTAQNPNHINLQKKD